MAQVSAADKQKANEFKDKGNKVLQAGQIDEAIDLYSEGLLLDPTNHLLYSNRAACFVKQGNWKGALVDSKKCVELAPTFGKGYLRLGTALLALKQVEEALAAYKKGLTLENDQGTAASLQSGLNEAQSVWNDMQSAKAAKSDGVGSEATRKAAELKQKGNDALSRKDYKKAIEHYSEAINIDLDNPVLYSNRSAAYANLTMWSEAYADAQRCNFLDAKFAKGWQRKGFAALGLKKFEEAKLAFNRGLDLEPDNQQMKQGLQDTLALERNKLFGIPLPSQSPTSQSPPSAPSEPNKQEAEAKPTESAESPKSPREEKKPTPKPPPKMSKKEESASAPTVASPKTDAPNISKAHSTPRTANKTDSSNALPAASDSSKIPKARSEDNAGDKKKGPVDTVLYDVLQVKPEASKAEVKKAYFKLAKIYHPDKSEDPKAEEMFKSISEAYDVLMDDEKRKMYDQFGIEVIRENAHGELDPSLLFKMIFGGGAFDDVFGELSFVLMASAKFNEQATKVTSEDELNKIIEEAQEKRKKTLVEILRTKLDDCLSGKDKDFQSQLEDIQSKADAPGGADLLSHVSYIYIQEGKKNMGRMLGIEGFFASVAEKGHNAKQMVQMVHAAVQMQQAQQKMEDKGEGVTQADADKMMGTGLNAIWKMGKFEIEQMLRQVCAEIMASDKTKKKKRAEALKELGELYKKTAKKVGKEKSGEQFEAFRSGPKPEKDAADPKA